MKRISCDINKFSFTNAVIWDYKFDQGDLSVVLRYLAVITGEGPDAQFLDIQEGIFHFHHVTFSEREIKSYDDKSRQEVSRETRRENISAPPDDPNPSFYFSGESALADTMPKPPETAGGIGSIIIDHLEGNDRPAAPWQAPLVTVFIGWTVRAESFELEVEDDLAETLKKAGLGGF